MIIRPARAGARRIWVGGVLEDDVIEPLCAWIRGGAVEPPPAKVAAMIFAPAGSSDVTAPVELRSAG